MAATYVTDPLILSALAVVAFFVRGLTGAASAIVFNALFVVAVSLGLSGGLTLLDGIYWMALANMLASLILGALLARSLRLDSLTVLLLCGVLPTTVLFALLLPHVNLGDLQLVMGVAVLLAGLHLARGQSVRRQISTSGLLLALPAGLAAGLLSGLFGMGGPAVILVLGPVSRSPTEFRNQFTIVATATNAVRLAALVEQGVYTAPQMHVFLATVPAIVAGLGMGYWAHRYLQPRVFQVGLGLLVGLAGLVAVAATFVTS